MVSSPITDNGVQNTSPYVMPSGPTLPLVVKYGFYPPITLDTPTRDVLSYLFAPPEDGSRFDRFPLLLSATEPERTIISDPNLFNPGRPKSPYAAWGDQALKLEDDVFKSEYVYRSILHVKLLSKLVGSSGISDRTITTYYAVI